MKKRLAIITGGYSGESVISYQSAETIAKNINTDQWDYYVIDIHPKGWFYKTHDGNKAFVNKNDFSIIVDGNTITFDLIFIAIHGTPGEDGKLQGYFDCLNIPYTSCDTTTSAITLNKRYTVAIAAFAGIPVSRSCHLYRDRSFDVANVLKELSLPVFVKPNSGGSSLGMSKVNTPDKLEAAVEKAFLEDTQVLIEEYISGREFTVGVFKSKGKINPLPITEIISKNEFFDFEAKYKGASKEITPAQIEDDIAEKIRSMAVKVYEVFNCRGIVRIDFIFDNKAQQPVMLEMNTIPGQSAASIVPQQVAAMGWSLKEFYSALLNECLIIDMI